MSKTKVKTMRLYDIKTMIIMHPKFSDAQHSQEPRKHDDKGPSSPWVSTSAGIVSQGSESSFETRLIAHWN